MFVSWIFLFDEGPTLGTLDFAFYIGSASMDFYISIRYFGAGRLLQTISLIHQVHCIVRIVSGTVSSGSILYDT